MPLGGGRHCPQRKGRAVADEVTEAHHCVEHDRGPRLLELHRGLLTDSLTDLL